ncbi:MAG: DUF4198 domain-containing protein [Candidatus Syntrophoarchaeum sp.]|nr:DUF4198 domain-containing protein [Candidatus Syntrophoarchaeum sp.]
MKLGTIMNAIVVLLAVIALGTCVLGSASAHFTMLFPGGKMDVSPADYIGELGETETVLIAWGHPYEHVLFDCPVVPEVYVRDPEGVITQLDPVETTVEGFKAYKVSFRIEKRGDYIVHASLSVPEHELVDHTKTVIHCGEEAWEGWAALLGEKVEVLPYTRPYGLEEGFVFTGKALLDGSPLAGATVEVEKYYETADAEAAVSAAEDLYAEDPPMMYTRVTTTDSDGDFAYTLDEPGIWFVGVYAEGDEMEERGVIVVPVFESFPPAEETGTSGLEDLEGRVSQLEEVVSGMSDKTPESPSVGILATIGILGALTILLRRRR